MASKGNTRSIKSEPAKSAVAKAVSSNVIPLTGGNGVAQGSALADQHYAAAVQESAGWRDRFAAILALGMGDANKAYRASFNKAKKANITDPDKTAKIGISRTAGVRMSECLTVAKAADRGLSMPKVVEMFNEQGIGKEATTDSVQHAWIVKAARMWNETHNADGAEVESANSRARAGRAALSATEKCKRYVLSTYKVEDLPQLARLMAALAKRVKTPEQAQAELAKHEAAIPVKGDRRSEPRTTETPREIANATQAANDKARVDAAQKTGPTKAIDPTPKRVKKTPAAAVA